MPRKRQLPFFLCLWAALLSIAAPVYGAAALKDIDQSYAKEAILKLTELGIVEGDGDARFYPEKPVTREEFVKLVVLTLKLDVSKLQGKAAFSDVPSARWSYAFVEKAAEAGIIDGTGPNTFSPAEVLTREQMSVLLVRASGVRPRETHEALQFADRGDISEWAQASVAYAAKNGWVEGTSSGTFHPKGYAERQQVALAIVRFMKEKEPKETKQSTEETPPGVNPGTPPSEGGAGLPVPTPSPIATTPAGEPAVPTEPDPTPASSTGSDEGDTGAGKGGGLPGEGKDPGTGGSYVPSKTGDPDTRAPVLSGVSLSVPAGEPVEAQSDETGAIYLVKTESVEEQASKAELDQAVSEVNGLVLPNEKDVPVTFDTTVLPPGVYAVYAVDDAGNVSEPELLSLMHGTETDMTEIEQ